MEHPISLTRAPSASGPEPRLTASVSRMRRGPPHSCEIAMLERNAALPLPHRSVWPLLESADAFWYIAIRSAPEAACILGFVAEETHLKSLPWHRVLRVRRFGATGSMEALAMGVRALAVFARLRRRVVRVHLEVHTRDAATRSAIARACEPEGFTVPARMLGYRDTIAIDLRPGLDHILAGFHSTGRQNVRAVEKNPVSVRPITDPGLAPRMTALLDETMARTAGPRLSPDWPAIIHFCESYPELGRLVGLFDDRPHASPALLAYALSYHHGDHVEYATAASTRATDLRMPLSYGLVWDLMQWGKATGARWFDFGGVTAGRQGGEDRRGGISDFKRYFSRETVEVGAEWLLEPRPFRAGIARAVGTMTSRVRARRAARAAGRHTEPEPGRRPEWRGAATGVVAVRQESNA